MVGFAVYFSSGWRDFNSILPALGVLAVGAAKLMPLYQQVYTGWSSVLSGQASVDDVLDLIEFEPLAEPQPDAIEFHDSLEFQKLSFHYSTVANPALVLRDIDLQIRCGEKIGIVGATGSGKSTMVDVLMGLLSPTGGQFSVDGRRVNPGNAAAWQRHIAHVPQSIYLSDATIAENIAFGIELKKIDETRLEAAARAAQIHEHVLSLPRAYHTAVGERGVRLSGGQRQRIGIARALYKRAAVLVLDEATSALDDDTERRVMQGLAEAAAGTTVIMIAHRLTTMRNCDRIIELEHGRIKRIVTYADLVDSQLHSSIGP
jgi:ATP-binding cassette subfamily B protein